MIDFFQTWHASVISSQKLVQSVFRIFSFLFRFVLIGFTSDHQTLSSPFKVRRPVIGCINHDIAIGLFSELLLLLLLLLWQCNVIIFLLFGDFYSSDHQSLCSPLKRKWSCAIFKKCVVITFCSEQVLGSNPVTIYLPQNCYKYNTSDLSMKLLYQK